MIEYLEVRNSTRTFVGVIDTATSIIWREDYYGAGEFEVYVMHNEVTRGLLQIGSYLSKPRSDRLAIIESVEYINNNDGAMIIAKGRMAKGVLDRRLAYSLAGHTITPIKISGNVADAVMNVVDTNAGTNAGAQRTMGIFLGSDGGITKTIKTGGEDATRQSSFQNLLEWTDGVLQEYGCGARITLSGQNLLYNCYEGTDRTADSATPVIFSQDFENLIDVDYAQDTTELKTFALVGGEGEGLDRFFATYGSSTGWSRREVFVDGISYPRKYRDAQDVEHTYTDAEYTAMLQGEAETALKEHLITETFEGKIDLTLSPFKFGIDFDLGDLVTVQDNRLGLFKDVRILSVTEVQDTDGYLINIDFGGENNGNL